MRRGTSSRAARGVLGGVCVAGAGVAGAAFVLAPPGPVKLVLLFVAFSIGTVMFPISQTVCAEIAPPARRGSVLGTYAAVYSTAGVIAPFLTGKLVDAGHGHSGYDTTFLVSAALLVVGGLAAAIFIRPERDARRLLQEV